MKWVHRAKISVFVKPEDNIDTIKESIKKLVPFELEKAKIELQEQAATGFEESFARITYRDAVKILQKNGFKVEFGDDLKHNHEQAIIEEMGKPTFIMKYPEKIKFFNMRRDRTDKEVVQSADLILPFSGEAVGSAVREEDPKLLVEKLVNSVMYKLHAERGGTLKEFKWYLDAVKKKPSATCRMRNRADKSNTMRSRQK